MKTKILMIYSTRVILFSLLFAVFAFSAQSQVTIGSTSVPLKNVLLDLKETDDASGNANSEKGLVLPRVFLTATDSLSPVLTKADPDYETLKPAYTGIIVYNVNATAPFEKGVYVWDGTQWNLMNAGQPGDISAANGLNLEALTDTVQLGGTLSAPTTVNLMDNNLIFNAENGKIGIETTNPQAALDIEDPNGNEELILKNLHNVTDANNPIEAANPTYYDLMISGKGVVRKAQSLSNGNKSIAYSLQSTTAIPSGNYDGSGGAELLWNRNGANTSIVLPEDGTYVFSFCLFGTLTIYITPTIPSNSYVPTDMTPTDVNSYYISAFRNDDTVAANLANIQEFILTYTQGYNYANYSILLTVAGNAGDVIHFKLAADPTRSTRFAWNLTSTGNIPAQKTNMIFWKL